ncbi:MAG: hypothetical protein RLZZ04_2575 [Cyanobacteriota bacterium]|jgi:hypothetical protein
MSKRIFYSWQSDLPNNINRSFILDCLERSVRAIASEDLSLDFEIDRDTLDVSGSPDIVATIFNKIDNATMFVADITFVTGGEGQRRSPNPNVLVELGYAANQHSWDNLICILNIAFGKIEELPFDMRSRRIVTYNLAPETEDKSTARKELVAKLTSAIKGIHEDVPRLARKLNAIFNTINPQIHRAVVDGQRRISVNLNNRNEEMLLDLVKNTSLSSLISITSNGNWLSNNTNSTGGLNDVGTGTLSGYNLEISDALATMIE